MRRRNRNWLAGREQSDTRQTERILIFSCNDVSCPRQTWSASTLVLELDQDAVVARARPFDHLVALHIRWKCTDIDGLLLPRDNEAAYLHLPGRAAVYVGPIGGNGSEVMVFVDPNRVRDAPWMLSTGEFARYITAPAVCEMLLGDAVDAVLSSDDCLGSLSIDTVQNRVNTLPFYRPALDANGTNRQFLTFIRRHQRVTGRWIFFHYEPDEVEFFVTPHHGLRLTLLERRDHCVERDLAREQIMCRAVKHFQSEYLVLRESLDPQSIDILRKSRASLTLREYKYSELIRRRAASESRSLVMHPFAPILMGRCPCKNPTFISATPERLCPSSSGDSEHETET